MYCTSVNSHSVVPQGQYHIFNRLEINIFHWNWLEKRLLDFSLKIIKKRKSYFKMVNLAIQLQHLPATAVWCFMPHSSLLSFMWRFFITPFLFFFNEPNIEHCAVNKEGSCLLISRKEKWSPAQAVSLPALVPGKWQGVHCMPLSLQGQRRWSHCF